MRRRNGIADWPSRRSSAASLLRLGDAVGAWQDATETLELALLRGTRPAAGSRGLLQEFARFRGELGKLRRQQASALHPSEPRSRLDDAKLDRAQALIVQLQG